MTPCPPLPLLAAVVLPPPFPFPPPCPAVDDAPPPAPPAEAELSPEEALVSAVDPEEGVTGVVEPQPTRSVARRSAEVRMGPSCPLTARTGTQESTARAGDPAREKRMISRDPRRFGRR